MVTTSNLEENGGSSFKGQFEEGEDYGLPQLDFSPLDPLEFNEIGSKHLPPGVQWMMKLKLSQT